MNRRVLIIAAHPDDEVLGCGGTASLHVKAGDEVNSIIVCEGETLRYGRGGAGQSCHMEQAAKQLGIAGSKCLGFPDQQLDTMNLVQIIQPLEREVRGFEPHIVYCQFGGDINRDHQLLFKAVMVATRPTESFVETVFTFDTASSTEWGFPRRFQPDTWVDISTTLEVKLAAMACYSSELRDYPHPRSLEALRIRARAWGNQSCMEAAEVFMTVRRSYRHAETPR